MRNNFLIARLKFYTQIKKQNIRKILMTILKKIYNKITTCYLFKQNRKAKKVN